MKNLSLSILFLPALFLYSCDEGNLQEPQNSLEMVKLETIDNQYEGEGQEAANSAYESLLDGFKSVSRGTEIEYPSWYGGCFVNEDGQLVILTTNVSEASITHIPNTIFKECLYSYSKLTSIVDSIRESANIHADFLRDNVSIFGIESQDNIVSVGLKNFTPQTITAFKQKICSHPAIKFVECGEIQFTSTTMTAGGEIKNKSKGTAASMGYRARTNDGKIGIVTAGHFIAKNQILSSPSNIAIGQCLYSRDRDGLLDAAFCQITNPDYTPSNQIAFSNNPTVDTLSVDLAQPPTGYTINMVGFKSKRKSGTVADQSRDIITEENGLILRDAMLMTCLPDSGDSGGIVYAYTSSINKRSTVGIIMGIAPYVVNGKPSPKGVCVKAYLINQTFGIKRY